AELPQRERRRAPGGRLLAFELINPVIRILVEKARLLGANCAASAEEQYEREARQVQRHGWFSSRIIRRALVLGPALNHVDSFANEFFAFLADLLLLKHLIEPFQGRRRGSSHLTQGPDRRDLAEFLLVVQHFSERSNRGFH